MHVTEADRRTGSARKTVSVDAKKGNGLSTNFDQILDAHAGMLSRIASQYEIRPAQREDLLQEMAFAIWRALPNWRGDASIKTFIARIAHNHGVNHVIADRRHGAHEDLSEDLPDGMPQPDQQAYRHQQARQLLKAIRRLPLGLQQVATLALEGFSHTEIADVLGITVNNVDVRLFRARKALKKAVKE